MSLESRYRLGVVGVFTNSEGLVLVGERSANPGAWQFPQGGIDDGEDVDTALRREMSEELGTTEFEIVEKAPRLVTYDFPAKLSGSITKAYAGQTHHWYKLRFKTGGGPNLDACDDEFSRFAWVSAKSAVAQIIDWKRDAYRQGLKLLGFKVD